MIINYRHKEVKLPDFLNVGAAKAGTTSLYYCLIQHPKIFMPKLKDPRFFAFRERPPEETVPGRKYDKRIIWKFEDYVKLFKAAKDNQILGEGTVVYLYTYKITIEHIKSLYGEKYKDLKIIIILRNPVERAYSHYLFSAKMGQETLTFEEAINPQTIKNRVHIARGYDYIGYGMYYNQVRAFLEEFPHVKIYLFEDLKNLRNLLVDLFEFLGVETDVEIDTKIMANPSGIPKNKMLVALLRSFGTNSIKYILPHKYKIKLASVRDGLFKNLLEKPEMSAPTREKMINLYRNDILELQKLIDRDLSHWLEVKNMIS